MAPKSTPAARDSHSRQSSDHHLHVPLALPSQHHVPTTSSSKACPPPSLGGSIRAPCGIVCLYFLQDPYLRPGTLLLQAPFPASFSELLRITMYCLCNYAVRSIAGNGVFSVVTPFVAGTCFFKFYCKNNPINPSTCFTWIYQLRTFCHI